MLAAGISDVVVADTNFGEVIWISRDDDVIEVAGTGGDGDIIEISDSNFGNGDVMGISSNSDAVLVAVIGDGDSVEHVVATCVEYSESGNDAKYLDGFKVNASVLVL